MFAMLQYMDMKTHKHVSFGVDNMFTRGCKSQHLDMVYMWEMNHPLNMLNFDLCHEILYRSFQCLQVSHT